jgi:hypothetical protein
MLAREVRRRTTNLTTVEGEMVSMVSMVSMTDWILGKERPRRRAVSAPMLPVLGPVMGKVRSLTWEEKSETMVESSVVMCGWRLSEVCSDY